MKRERHIRSSLYKYLMGGVGGIFLLYLAIQYMIFQNAYHQAFLKEASHIEQIFQEILENYKSTLKNISHKIIEKDLFS